MEKQKVQVLVGLAGVGILIVQRGLSNALSEAPGMFSMGRFTFVVSIYLVVVLYSLWKMFIPSWVKIPEYSESEYHPGATFADYWLRKKKKED
jgi:hypothetical protein